MKKHKWVRIVGTEPGLDGGLTWILFSRKESYLIPEWQPVGQVTYRQVYDKQDPRWYAWTFSRGYMDMKDITFPSMETGMEFVERYHALAHDEIEIVS